MSTNILGEWDRLSKTLDDDMMLIYPQMYIDNQEMFDDIVGVGYLIKDLRTPERLDWVTEHQLQKILRKHANIIVVTKLLIVRLRLPWNEVRYEWFCNQQELEEHADEYEILSTILYVRHNGGRPEILTPGRKAHYETHPEEYELVDIRYCVRYKLDPDQLNSLLSNPYANGGCHADLYVEE